MLAKKFVVVFIAGLVIAASTGSKMPKVGDKAPLFVLRDINGVMVSLHMLCGDRVHHSRRKVVVLDFFQVVCKPCIEELPEIKRFHDTWKDDERVKFFMVGVGENQERLAKFKKDHNADLPMLADPYLVTSRNFGVKTFPIAMIIDRNRIIRFIVKDKQPKIDELLTSELKKVLGE